MFRTVLALIHELELAEMKGELKKRLTQLVKYDVLVSDELGYLPMTRQACNKLFQLINSLYEYSSIIRNTNKDFTAWSKFFHDDNVAAPLSTWSSTAHTPLCWEERSID
ncbi:ATP-binding protein [Microbulbifer taiwanensis]|uniref:ATP-binding protein n=1 Tax=Microbulbifer taiwanensis TaxID=986746 RepID=A0ABW1YIQ5_9GAMM|nr:ATP-binding protein [Microbulbifer taiwanensis]